jgi:hypothetical protein
MTLATVDSAFVGVGKASALAEASPWRIDMRSIVSSQLSLTDR